MIGIPMSYLNIDLDRSTAKGKSVQLFTDIDERWATGHDYDYDNFPLNNVSSLAYILSALANTPPLAVLQRRCQWHFDVLCAA